MPSYQYDKELQIEEREKDELFHLAIDAIPNVVIVASLQGEMILVNKQVEKMFGYTKEELLGQPVEILMPSNFRQRHVGYRMEFFNKHETRMMGKGLDLHAKRKDGTEFPVEIGLNSFSNSKGKFVLATIVDITVRKQMEEVSHQVAIAQAADAAKSKFLAGISHEIRTPLSSMVGLTELLYHTKLDTEQKEYVRTLYSSEEFLLSLINDLLDFSKIQAKEIVLCKKPFNLYPLIKEILALFDNLAREHNNKLSLTYHNLIPEIVIGDAKRLKQVLFNLIGNAIKFTENGTITIKIEVISIYKTEITLRFEVSDSGIGIAPENQEIIFEQYKQADESTYYKYGGTGLGLTISKELVDLMQGSIGVNSELGKGSCFWFEIPLTISTQLETLIA